MLILFWSTADTEHGCCYAFHHLELDLNCCRKDFYHKCDQLSQLDQQTVQHVDDRAADEKSLYSNNQIKSNVYFVAEQEHAAHSEQNKKFQFENLQANIVWRRPEESTQDTELLEWRKEKTKKPFCMTLNCFMNKILNSFDMTHEHEQ